MATQPSKLNNIFWWLRHDWVTYKVPVSEGKVLLSQDVLDPKLQPFQLNVEELWYSFVHSRKDRRKIADFSGWSSGMFFVNERAFRAFEDMFLRHGRAFPVRCSNEPHYIVLIDTVIDAMDLERSEFERLDMYPDLARDAARTLKVVVKEGFTSAADIFRDGPKETKYDLLVSDAFKTRYEQSGLTGLVFRDTRGG